MYVLPVFAMMAKADRKREWDKTFKALGHPIRRELMCLLDKSEGDTVQINQVSNHLATTQDITTERAKMKLLHFHLPKLQEFGFIDYDTRSGTIRYQKHESMEEILDSELLSSSVCC